MTNQASNLEDNLILLQTWPSEHEMSSTNLIDMFWKRDREPFHVGRLHSFSCIHIRLPKLINYQIKKHNVAELITIHVFHP